MFTDRIVSAAVIHCGGETPTVSKTWLLNHPGLEIPTGASDIHGITTARARAEGREPRGAIVEIADELAAAGSDGEPIVIANAPFDLTMLREELLRPELELPIGPAMIVDPLVLDKHCDPYRKGSRKPDALAAHYRCKLDRAHDASSDAITAARVAYRIAQEKPGIGSMTLLDLQTLQRDEYRKQATSLNDYWIKKGDPKRVDNYEWPIRSPRAA